MELTARVCASCVQDPEEKEKSMVAVVRLSADSYRGGALYKLGLDKEWAKPCVMLTAGVARM